MAGYETVGQSELVRAIPELLANFSDLVQKELRLGTLATAEVTGLDPVRDFYSVRLATRSRRRLTDAFLLWCRERLAADFAPALP